MSTITFYETKLNKAIVKKLRCKNRMRTKEIANNFKCSESHVRRIAAQIGIKLATNKKKEIYEYYKKHGVKATSKKFKISENYVYVAKWKEEKLGED